MMMASCQSWEGDEGGRKGEMRKRYDGMGCDEITKCPEAQGAYCLLEFSMQYENKTSPVLP